jgi:hypothetical protein
MRGLNLAPGMRGVESWAGECGARTASRNAGGESGRGCGARPGARNARLDLGLCLPLASGVTTLLPVSEVTADALDAEDQKIITLARSTRARVAASEGAAVRDETGRTYTAAAVALPSLRLSALRLAVAMAVSSGAERLEAAALVSDSEPDPGDLAAVRDLGPDAPIFHAAPDGSLRATLTP